MGPPWSGRRTSGDDEEEMSTLSVTVHEGHNLRGGFLGMRDPYCLLKLGSQTVKTRTINNKGKNPVWNETLTLSYRDGKSAVMQLIVKDEDLFKDDLMGEAALNVSSLVKRPVQEHTVPLQYKSKPAGTIRLTLKLQGQAQANSPPHPPQQGQLPMRHQNSYGNPPPSGGYYPPQPYMPPNFPPPYAAMTPYSPMPPMAYPGGGLGAPPAPPYPPMGYYQPPPGGGQYPPPPDGVPPPGQWGYGAYLPMHGEYGQVAPPHGRQGGGYNQPGPGYSQQPQQQ